MALTAMSLPQWAQAWKKDEIRLEADALLAALVNAIIPETDTPGAKTVGAHLFIQRMVKDCFESKDAEAFQQGLLSIEGHSLGLFQKPFQDLSMEQQVKLLKNLSARGSAEDKTMVQILKRMSIQAYTNSEYFLTKHRNYTIAPGYYHGCVPVKA